MPRAEDPRKPGFRQDAFSDPEGGSVPGRRRYFEAVLLADLRDPPHVRLALGRGGSLRGRLAGLEEEPLEPARANDGHNPAGRGSYVLEGVQGALGDVGQRPRARPSGTIADQRLDSPFQDVQPSSTLWCMCGGGPPSGGLVSSTIEYAPPVSE